jgi:hypothetical protein
MGSVALVLAVGLTRDGGEIEGVKAFEYIGGLHTEADVPYTENPGVGGPHDPVWQNCGVYADEIREEHVVHSLEHGAVWITYRKDDLSDGELEGLVERFRERRYVIVSPRASQDSPVVLSAWNRRLAITAVDDPRIGIFVARYAEGPQAPESGAPCHGGTDATLSEPVDRAGAGSMNGTTPTGTGKDDGDTLRGDETGGDETGSSGSDVSGEPLSYGTRYAAEDGKPRGERAVQEPVQEVLREVVGMRATRAGRVVRERGLGYRIEERDGVRMMLTLDFDAKRINVTIENGVVVAARRG